MADYAGAVATAPAPALPRVSQDVLRRWALWIPMAAILVGQAALSIRLAQMSTASGDEGRYIYAGHQLIHELWHGGGSPYYETFFSGAPVRSTRTCVSPRFESSRVPAGAFSLQTYLTAFGPLMRE